jgi:uncharacterized protein
MPYLVDGNNVMAQTVGWHKDRSAARKKLVRDLAAFVAAHRVGLKVVFDGVPDEQFPEGSKYKSVQVMYARPGSDADSRILDLVEKSSSRRDLIVVTSDKALGSRAQQKGARVIQSGKFRTALEEASRLEKEKPGEQDPVDLVEWLDFFGREGK